MESVVSCTRIEASYYVMLKFKIARSAAPREEKEEGIKIFEPSPHEHQCRCRSSTEARLLSDKRGVMHVHFRE